MSNLAPRSLGERKAWALSQGNPTWLWPEVAVSDWQLALLEIEQACMAVLAGARAQALAADPMAMGLAGYTSGMGPMLGQWIQEGLISASPAISGLLTAQLSANSARMESLLASAAQIAAHFAAAGIGVTLLKGVHTASTYFRHAGCRPMSDIDILISPDDLGPAARVLGSLGYRQTEKRLLESCWRHRDGAGEPRTTMFLEADDPWSVDLHVSLDVKGPPGARPARVSQVSHLTAPAPAIPGAEQLAQPALLMHLAAHAGSGFHSLTLLRLFEIVLVTRRDRASGALSWDRFAELGAATGSLAFAYPALALARRLSPDDIPHSIVDCCARSAPTRVTSLVHQLRPASAHRIDRPTLREHFAWTSGPGGWLQRLAADVMPAPGSVRQTAAIQASRARGLWRANRPQP